METKAFVKEEVEKNYNRLVQLRDQVKLKLHLASLDVKTEWEEKLAPHVFDVEQKAKQITDSKPVGDLVKKLEEFLVRLGGSNTTDGAPRSTH